MGPWQHSRRSSVDMKQRLGRRWERITLRSPFALSPAQSPWSVLPWSWPSVVIQKLTAKDQSPNPNDCFTNVPQWQGSKLASSWNSASSTLQGLGFPAGHTSALHQACPVPRVGCRAPAAWTCETPFLLALKSHMLYKTTAFGGRLAWSEGTCREYSLTRAGAFLSIS